MTTGQAKDILTTVDEVLAGKQLLDQPRAVLLMRMCQFCLLFAPQRTEHYWQLLQPLQGKVPAELQEDLKTLRSTLEEALPSGTSGFTAQMLFEVKSAQDASARSVEEEKRRLVDIETRLRKRLLPFGKGPVWTALVEAWIPIDRAYALQLLKNVSPALQDAFLTRTNKARPLTPEEWTTLEKALGMSRAEQMVLKVLDDSGQTLRLPEPMLRQAAALVRNSLLQFTSGFDESKMVSSIQQYSRLLAQHVSGEAAAQVPGLLEELYLLVAKSDELELHWMERFNLLVSITGLGMQLNASGAELMTPDSVARLVSKTPPYLASFVWAQWFGLSAVPGQANSAYAELMEKTKQNPEAEAWFLVTLVKRGLGDEAMALATASRRAAELLARLRRAWLCSHPESAVAVISPADTAGDPVGEFLAQGNAQQRAAYLQSMTQDGVRPIPGAMWAGVGTETEPEGLRSFWQRLTAQQKSLDQVIHEYLARNPLYSSYTPNTKKEVQFSEALRVTGFGEYRYQDVDRALLAALVAWGDQEPQRVQAVLRAMWYAIRPDELILMVDWLRNAILARCVNVFAADATVLTQDYLPWLKRELVDRGRQWHFGKQVMTLRYPGIAPMQFCVGAASAVGGLSPARRDQILLMGLERFEVNPALAEAAAQLYNSDKAPLSLDAPPKLKSNLLAGWQMGIVKGALMHILQALMAQAASASQARA
jgi:uncharacterized protein YecT (DUF1311 family)